MKLFGKKNENYTMVIGCGRLGANLANALSDIGESVAIIDKNPDAFRKLASSFGGLTVTGDATEISVLDNADIAKATAVISVTNKDNTNIMVALLAKKMYNIKRVVARLYDPDCECVYDEFGIETICPAVLSAKEIDKFLPEFDLSEKTEIAHTERDAKQKAGQLHTAAGAGVKDGGAYE
ncbi:MAG: TrkA family potassium uptake protein [Oscillospiraceae bacterium]|nr:TrkA family potassium uptake protein [Oscillospiraceae bacterium]